VDIVNFIASNVSKLGAAHPISPGSGCFFLFFFSSPERFQLTAFTKLDIKRDDGLLAVGIIDNSWSRSATVGAGLHMRNGKHLLQHRAVMAFLCREFRLRPKQPEPGPGGKSSPPLTPFNIDGDPHPAKGVHVRCLKQAINVFHLP
jgi:diacylglycerol kinase family enzyme